MSAYKSHPEVADSPTFLNRACDRTRPGLLASVLAWILLIAGLAVEPPSFGSTPTTPLSFERDIRPILKAHCFHCHGEGEKLKGGVDLRLRRFMLTNSESGSVLVPGNSAESLLLGMVASGKMPKGEKKLSSAETAKIQSWIDSGAPTLRPEPDKVPRFFITEEERNFWSFQPIRRPQPPASIPPSIGSNPIDHFLWEPLHQRGLGFANPAARGTLIRRVTFDLTGLAPTAEEVDAFVNDASSEAYNRLIERLLASPRYGEKWARHWLDVAGYADSNGGVSADSERPWAWRYRDYVIRSLNADKPWDQFITEQLAGDELVNPPLGDLQGDDLDKLIATGFLRLAPDPTGDEPADPDLVKNQVIADTVQIVATSLLGVTLQCAQCHDHRYDPIPQTDYYRLRAFFEPAFDWKHWKNPNARLISLMSAEDRHHASCLEHAAQAIDGDANRLQDDLIEEFVQKQLELVPAAMRGQVIAARKTPADKRTEEHKRLLGEFPTFQDQIILDAINAPGAKRVEEVRKRAAEIRAMKPIDPLVHCLAEEPGKAVETFLFHRGDHQQPAEKVAPGGLTVLQGLANDSALAPCSNSTRRTTGRRLQLAKILTDGSHPLVARVLVNRVWHHYFGTGIVPTLADFGMLGEKPSHPELLDWLASEFMSSGWSLKKLHRRILQSTTYRQSSVNTAAQAVDPDNRLLGRMRPRRLPSESIRDAMLAISHRMNTNMYGPSVPVAVSPQGQFVVGIQVRDKDGDPAGVDGIGGSEFRRSIYVRVRRSMPVGVMETFDSAGLSPNCEARAVSTVPAQALMFLNDHFVIERSTDLAERLRKEHSGDVRKQVDLLWKLLFSAPPSTEELQRSLVYLAEQNETLRAQAAVKTQEKPDLKAKPSAGEPDPSLQALASLCQVLWASNRFLYLD